MPHGDRDDKTRYGSSRDYWGRDDQNHIYKGHIQKDSDGKTYRVETRKDLGGKDYTTYEEV